MMLGWNQGRFISLGLINLIIGGFLLSKFKILCYNGLPVSGLDKLLLSLMYTARYFWTPFAKDGHIGYYCARVKCQIKRHAQYLQKLDCAIWMGGSWIFPFVCC